ncbi:MAG: hypothetical protein QOH47_2376 [Sphingomonadales bacterium]|jgi:hypothetical protein|nr:hypothetical protein [Sphingomonadales bacterium]
MYRVIAVKTTDYGDGPATGRAAWAVLSVVPDGSHWQSRPTNLEISVPVGSRPGGLWKLTLEAQE